MAKIIVLTVAVITGVNNMDRLLSEKAVIEALQNRIGESITDCIKAIPSAEQKTGHWIYKPKTDLSICDKCGSYCPQDKYGRIETNFCPNCGCRMIEPTCDTCEYSTAAFNPCNACKDKSEYKPQEGEDKE